MIRALPALALMLVLVAVACSSNDGDGDGDDTTSTSESAASVAPTADSADCAPSRARAAGETRATIASGGVDRSYVLHIPARYTGEEAVSLVLVLHAFGGDAQGIADLTAFGAAADADGFIAVFPEAAGTPQSWNAEAFPTAADDVGFIRDLLVSLEESLCVDPARIHATGYSNGGAMALRAACDLPGVLAAVAPVAAPFPLCQAKVPIIAFHGSLDTTVPYEGGVALDDGVNHAPVHRSVSEWASALGCDTLPVISRAAAEVELATYARCPLGDNEVLLYTVLNGGHTWPGAAIDYPLEDAGVTTHAISATDEIVEFFASHRKP